MVVIVVVVVVVVVVVRDHRYVRGGEGPSDNRSATRRSDRRRLMCHCGLLLIAIVDSY